MATAYIPQALRPGRSLVGAGVGAFGDQTGFAFGASYRFNDDRTTVKLGASATSDGRVGGGGGIGVEF